MENMIKTLVRIKANCYRHMNCFNCIFYSMDSTISECKIQELLFYLLKNEPRSWDEKEIRGILK